MYTYLVVKRKEHQVTKAQINEKRRANNLKNPRKVNAKNPRKAEYQGAGQPFVPAGNEIKKRLNEQLYVGRELYDKHLANENKNIKRNRLWDITTVLGVNALGKTVGSKYYFPTTFFEGGKSAGEETLVAFRKDGKLCVDISHNKNVTLPNCDEMSILKQMFAISGWMSEWSLPV
jgi:hypothetical protein